MKNKHKKGLLLALFLFAVVNDLTFAINKAAFVIIFENNF